MSINSFHSDTSFIPNGLVINPINLTSALAITVPKGANGIIFSCTGTGGIRLTFGNQVPSATVGLVIPPTLEPVRLDMLPGLKLQVIEGTPGSGATIQYSFLTIRS